MSRPSHASVLHFESLEVRQVMSGHALAALGHQGPSHAASMGEMCHGNSNVEATILSAKLSADDANVGSTQFKSITVHGETRETFTVAVHNLAADTTFDV